MKRDLTVGQNQRRMSRRSPIGIFSMLVACWALCLAAASGFGQTTADILGTVTDASGANVPNAKVTLTNLKTGVVQQTTTSGTGDYLFPLLLNGAYSIKIEAQGYKAFSATSLILTAGSRLRVDAHLEVGSLSETITVTTAPPPIQTDSSSTGTTLTEKPVEDLPLNGRNFINLVQLAAGMNNGPSNAINNGTRPDDRRMTSSYTANAMDPSANNNLVDGMDNNERLVATLGVRPSVESIAEVQVLTGNYSAEIARTGGGATNIITKGGTNEFHGSAYEFLRNDLFDAKDVLATTGSKPKLRQNQYGGSVGGPIKKERMFFFGDYEGLRTISGITAQGAVPTLYENKHPGDFSDITCTQSPCTGLSGPVISSTQFDTAGLNYFKLFPAPDLESSTPGGINYVNTVNQTQYQHLADGRIDYHLSNGDSLFGRYTFNRTTTDTPSFFPAVDVAGETDVLPNGAPMTSSLYNAGNSTEQIGNLLLTYTRPLSNNLVGELKAGYTRINILTTPLNYGRNLGNAFGIPNSNFSMESSELPQLMYANTSYGNLGGTVFLPIAYKDNTFEYAGSVTYIYGKHTFKSGASLIRRQLKNQQADSGAGWIFMSSANGPYASTYGGWDPNGLFNLLTGTVLFRKRSLELYPPNYRTWEPGFYVQDDWRALPWLTLNLGVRYDVFTPYIEIDNHISNFDPTATNAYGGTGALVVAGQDGVSRTAGVQTDYTNVAPRFGFAATVSPKTVLRGGFGLTNFPTNYQSQFNLKNPPFTTQFQDYNTLSTAYPDPTASSAKYPNGPIASSIQKNYKSAVLDQLNLTLQRDVAGNVLTVSYVGLLGRHMTVSYNIDQAEPNKLGNTYAAQKLRKFFGDTSTGKGLYCGVDSKGNILTEAECAPNGENAPALGANGVSSITYNNSGGTSSFHALEATFDRRPQRGLGWNVNYTWEHAIDNVSVSTGGTGSIIVPDNFKKLDKGNGGNELQQRIAASINYELPFASHAKGLKSYLFGGWQANTIVVWNTGTPFTVLNNSNVANTDPGGSSLDRPNQVASWKISNPSPSRGFFNTAAFQQQEAGTLGSEKVNQLFGPHFRHWDVSGFKNFKPTERITSQFRVEFFNVTNTPNWGTPDYKLGDAAFGQISSTAGYGTPRQLQFAVKVLF